MSEQSLIIEKYTGELEALMPLLTTADPDPAVIKLYLKDASVFVIRDAGAFVAVAVLCIDGKAAELKNIAVAQSHQGQGLAKLLIARLIDEARLLEATTISVGTGNSSLSQLALYQKSGFRIDHVITDFFASYPEPIYENGMRCIDMVVLVIRYE